jgi:hypothetical protein
MAPQDSLDLGAVAAAAIGGAIKTSLRKAPHGSNLRRSASIEDVG